LPLLEAALLIFKSAFLVQNILEKELTKTKDTAINSESEAFK